MSSEVFFHKGMKVSSVPLYIKHRDPPEPKTSADGRQYRHHRQRSSVFSLLCPEILYYRHCVKDIAPQEKNQGFYTLVFGSSL
jgi:hypothetical protein